MDSMEAFSRTFGERRGSNRTGLTPQKLQLGGTGLTPLKHGGLELSPDRAFSTGLTPINLNIQRSRGGGGGGGNKSSSSKRKKRHSSGGGGSGMPPVNELSPMKEDWQPSASFTPLKNMEWGSGFTPIKDTTDWGSLNLSPLSTPNFAKGVSGTTPRTRDLPSRQFWAGLPSPMRPSPSKRPPAGQGSQAKKSIKLGGSTKSSTDWPSPTAASAMYLSTR